MLNAEDPRIRAGVWESLSMQLEIEPVAWALRGGVANGFQQCELLSYDERVQLLESMKNATVTRSFTGRGRAVGPHFSGEITDDGVLAKEIVLVPLESGGSLSVKQIQNDFTLIVTVLFYGRPAFDRLTVPLNLEVWPIDDVDFVNENGQLIFTKKI